RGEKVSPLRLASRGSGRDDGGFRLLQVPHCSPPPAPLYRRMADRLLIVDFGSQVTQLIARRVREAGVYCEIHPFQSVDAAKIEKFDPRGIILSGGPASVIEGEAPAADPAIFTANVPVLGICYGEQTMAQQLGGQVEGGHHREFGRAEVEVRAKSALFDGVW